MPYVIPALADLVYSKIEFARNRLSFFNENLTGQSAVYEADLDITEDYTPIATLQVKERPASGKGGEFVYSEILNSYLKYNPPKFNQSLITLCPDVINKFRLTTYANRPANQKLFFGYALKAGLSYRDFPVFQSGFFTSLQNVYRRFLTFQPDNKIVAKNQPEYLYFLVNFTPTPGILKLWAGVNYTDGTSEAINKLSTPSGTFGQVFCIPVGHDALKLAVNAGDKTVKSYQIWLTDQAGKLISEARTYIIDTVYRRNESFFIFNNSLGGFDTLRATGAVNRRMSIAQEVSGKYLAPDYFLPDAQGMVSTLTGIKETLINSGFIGRAYQDYLQELFLATDIYEVAKAGFLPVRLSQKELVFESPDDYLPSAKLGFEHLYEEKLYSKLPEYYEPIWERTGGISCKYAAPRTDSSIQAEEQDLNPFSPSFQQTRIVEAGFDFGACPLDIPLFARLIYDNQVNVPISGNGLGSNQTKGDVIVQMTGNSFDLFIIFSGTVYYRITHNTYALNRVLIATESEDFSVIIDTEYQANLAVNQMMSRQIFDDEGVFVSFEEWTYSIIPAATYQIPND